MPGVRANGHFSLAFDFDAWQEDLAAPYFVDADQRSMAGGLGCDQSDRGATTRDLNQPVLSVSMLSCLARSFGRLPPQSTTAGRLQF